MKKLLCLCKKINGVSTNFIDDDPNWIDDEDKRLTTHFKIRKMIAQIKFKQGRDKLIKAHFNN